MDRATTIFQPSLGLAHRVGLAEPLEFAAIGGGRIGRVAGVAATSAIISQRFTGGTTVIPRDGRVVQGKAVDVHGADLAGGTVFSITDVT